MRVRVPREEFVRALAAVAVVTGGRTTKPILGCVRLATEGDALELSGTDGEAGLRVWQQGFGVQEPGVAVVGAERLLSIVREMGDAEISLEADDRYCIVRAEGREFRLFVQADAEFPPVPAFEDEPDLVVEGRELARMVELTAYAAARETSRYAINGVLWEKRGRRLYLVATDGRRLARAGGTVRETSAADFEVVVPVKALQAFERVFSGRAADEGWVVDVKVMPNQLLLRSDGCVLSTVLVEGTFPKYQDVIPKQGRRSARLDRAEFHGAIRQAALLTSDESRAVTLAFEGAALIITAQSAEQGQARVELPAEFEGEPLTISFNPLFIRDALKALTCPQVRMEFEDGFRPGVISGEERDDFVYVIMPVSM